MLMNPFVDSEETRTSVFSAISPPRFVGYVVISLPSLFDTLRGLKSLSKNKLEEEFW